MAQATNCIGKVLQWIFEGLLFIGWFIVVFYLWDVFWGMEQGFLFYLSFGIIFLAGIGFNGTALWHLYQGRKTKLTFNIVRALLMGLGFSLFAASMEWTPFTQDWIAPWGDIFMNLLKMIAVPLILFSIIKGIGGLSDVARLGRLGVKTLLFYVGTTFLAITVGLLVVNLIKPGEQADQKTRVNNRKQYERYVHQQQSEEGKKQSKVRFKDTLRVLSEEEKAKAKKKEYTIENEEVKKKVETYERTKKERGPLTFLVEMVPRNIFVSFTDFLMLQVIAFAIFFGVTLLLIDPKKGRPVQEFVEGGNEVFIKMVEVIMKAAPFFVFALLAGQVTGMAQEMSKETEKMGNELMAIIQIFKSLGFYALTVVLGLATLMFVIYPLAVMVFTRRFTYRQFFKAIGPAQMLAFSTSSSAATLPVTMDRVRDNMKVRQEVSGFVLPIGATVNMDGTSLYQGVAAVFLAQFHMVDLSLFQQITIVLTATLASIGSAAVPSAGIIMLITVLEAVGLPGAWIGIILPVDRILDMCRTSVNVTGDATVTSLIAKSEKDGFQAEEE
ncbi:MAG: dicarboxylate/amino acid:cation symporter [Flavobacteriales bacterium]